MRRFADTWFVAVSLALIALAARGAFAQEAHEDLQWLPSQEAGHTGCGCGDAGHACGTCGGHAGLLGRHRAGCPAYAEGADPWFNCQCDGSYKFPVPPLFTYHWIGIYSHRLMTDYHSPWRFPAVVPFERRRLAQVEPLATAPREQGASGEILPASSSSGSHYAAPRLGRPEPLSEKMRRLYR